MRFNLIIIFTVVFTLPAGISVLAQDTDFILNTGKPEVYSPAYVGNGHLSISSSKLGTEAAESYMINFYDKAENDISRIAALPSWNEINYFNGNNWLNNTDVNSDDITGYKQSLNMLDGFISTSYTWHNSLNRQSNIAVQTFISRSNKNLAVIRFDLTTDFSDEVILSFPITEREYPDRLDLAVLKTIDFGTPNEWPYFWYPGFTEINDINGEVTDDGGLLRASLQTEGRNTKAWLASQVYFDENSIQPDISISKTDKSASVDLKFKTRSGSTYIFYKLVSVVPEFEKVDSPHQAAFEIVKQSKVAGFKKLFGSHKSEWEKLWNTDIIIEGDSELQKIVRSMIFYLLCSVDAGTDFSIPPMGLSTSGYFGHVFWDSDIYMMPPILLMHPEYAESLVKFRYHTLPSAIENAKLNGYKGAMYPWESDEIGEEATPYFAFQNALRENHVVGDVAFSQWQYFTALKDTSYLRKYGAEIIRQTADYWLSRVTYNVEKERYEIKELISVSESNTYVDNETYTNSVAKINLDLAIKTSELLGLKVNPNWSKVRDKLFIPFDNKKKFHPLYENAEAGEGVSLFWSSVVNLLAYPLQVPMDDETKRNDLRHAVKSLEQHGAGAMMGVNFLSIIAAELGSDSLLNYTINKTLKGYLKPPFNVLSETHENKSVNFLTGAGSFLQQIIFGYTGLRITDDGVVPKYNPMLPASVKKLILKNFTVNNKLSDIIVENNKLRVIPR